MGSGSSMIWEETAVELKCEQSHSCVGHGEQYSVARCIRVKEIDTPKQEAMVGKCANNSCSAIRSQNAGKLFRLDLQLGSRSGAKSERKVEYLWLCASCAEVMLPKVVVRGDTVTLLLTKIDTLQLVDTQTCADRNALLKQAN
jgi:hypothetical protein